MKILGLFGGYYNPAACLFVDGRMTGFIEEEKLTRKKLEHQVHPVRAVKYVLDQAGITMNEVDLIAFPWDDLSNILTLPFIALKELVKSTFMGTAGSKRIPVPSRIPTGLAPVMTLLNAMPFENRRKILSELRYGGILERLPPIVFVPHHKSHAASCFYASGFDRGLILVMDGMGDALSTSVWVGEGKALRCIRKIGFPNSLGEYYSAFTEYLGFRPYADEGKLMGLAAYGKRDDDLVNAVRREVLQAGQGSYKVNSLYTVSGKHNFGERYTDALVNLFGPPRPRDSALSEHHYNLAFAVQYMLEQAAAEVLRDAMTKTGIRDVCITGGVAMNCKMNGWLVHELPVERVFINPASNDAGSAMGAAMVAAIERGDDCRFTMKHAFWGPGFSNEAVEKLLKESKVTYRRTDRIAEEVSDLLVQEKIIGWHQGRMEVGARALGGRSILASPLRHEMLDKVNNEVKHREPWRPFAPALLAEEAANYYSLGKESPFMILAFQVLADKRTKIPAVTHVDNSCRPQTVEREHHAKYYDTIKLFGQKTGVPVILNTSFNIRGEPIVCTPMESLRCFFATGLDVLAIEDFIVRKDGR